VVSLNPSAPASFLDSAVSRRHTQKFRGPAQTITPKMDQISTITLSTCIVAISVSASLSIAYFVVSKRNSQNQRLVATENRNRRFADASSMEPVQEKSLPRKRNSAERKTLERLPKFQRATGVDSVEGAESLDDVGLDDVDVQDSTDGWKREIYKAIWSHKLKWFTIFTLFLVSGLLASAQSLVLGELVDKAITPHMTLVSPYSDLHASESDLTQLFFRLMGVYITCVLVKMCCLTIAVSLSASLVAICSKDIRDLKARHLLLMSYSARLEFSEGDLLEIGGGDQNVIEECLYQLCYNLPLCLCYIIGAYFFGIAVGGVVAFVSLTSIIIAVLLGSKLAMGKATSAQLDRTKEEATAVGHWKEMVALLYPLISSHQANHRFWSRWTETSNVLETVHESANRSGFLIRVTSEMMVEVVITAALMSMSTLAFYGRLSVGTIFALSNIIWEISPPVATLSEVVYKVVRSTGPWKRLARLRHATPINSSLDDTPSEDALVEIDSVVVKYPGKEDIPRPPALDKVSLRLHAGERVAIMGPSGSGKSTFIGLVNGFLSEFIQDGSLKYSGNVVTVWQETRLFKGTVLDNLLLGFPDNNLPSHADSDDELSPPKLTVPTMQQVEEACKAAMIHDVISSLPHGYFTLVGEAGDQAGEETQATLLSVGQRQRLSIARGLLHLGHANLVPGPRILCFDEPTAALDDISAAAIDSLIGHPNDLIPSDVLVMSVTHDASLALECSRLLIVVSGKIVADGKPSDLLDKMGGRMDVSKL
jgi:ABC-type multidrug transport system fused ATPase/permease subunit